MLGKTVLITGGKTSLSFAETFLSGYFHDTVVCADSGLEPAYRLGVPVDYFMGDFDSVDPQILAAYQEGRAGDGQKAQWIQYPTEKDYVDTQLVLEWILEKGAEEIVILGATGGRMDHFLANLNLLMFPLKQGVPAYIVDPGNRIRLIDRELTISRSEQYGKYISLQPLTSEVTGVTLSGFQYPLQDYTLHVGTARAVSNEFAQGAEAVRIQLRTGVLIVVESMDEARTWEAFAWKDKKEKQK